MSMCTRLEVDSLLDFERKKNEELILKLQINMKITTKLTQATLSTSFQSSFF